MNSIKPHHLSKWIICSFLTILIIIASLFDFYPLQFLENKVYDQMSRLRPQDPAENIAVIAIDDNSIKEIGPWPWPRSKIAEMVQYLAGHGVDAIGIDLLFSTPETNDGLDAINNLRAWLKQNASRLDANSSTLFEKRLNQASIDIDNDTRLFSALMPAKNVVLPFYFNYDGKSKNNEQVNLEDAGLLKHSIPDSEPKADFKTLLLSLHNPVMALKNHQAAPDEILTTHKTLAKAAGAHGHINISPDPDGVVRHEALFFENQGRLFPSLAVQLALAYKGIKLKDLETTKKEKNFTGIRIGDLKVPTEAGYQMFINYNVNRDKLVYSFTDVLNGKVPDETFKNKAVMIGLTAHPPAALHSSPVHKKISDVEIKAQAFENIFSENPIKRPYWAWALETAVLLYFGFFILFVISRVSIRLGALILGSFLAVWYVIVLAMFYSADIWFKAATPTILAIGGYLSIIAVRKFSVAYKQDEHSETNKMLGISFQGQGLLDMALEYFMKCPLRDPSVKEKLYNLGLDFERKRMFNKAVFVYEHISNAGDFKDIKEKIIRLKSAEQQIHMGSTGNMRNEATMRLDSADTLPTLGRYEIMRILGQGAIGTIYLGKDPKINREVAIKTLRYEETNEKEFKDVKDRFLHEAEAAGRLNHPNIVTIYDAGEDMDVIYMAMELLTGKDLTAYTKEGSLLPAKEVIRIIIKVAEALNYAHDNAVVHRDIKPANIMLLDKGQVKVTDFGIARLMNASQTQTGVVIGTPNYMSPEQVLGKRVDGRSDLFSLGSVFYELLTGLKPFKHDNIGPLMHNIASCNFKPLIDVAPLLPECCGAIINKLLVKDPNKRFQNADTVARKLQECLKEIEG
ncbi:MAG: CHASE2 domain-containing protein [Proteobacteria bacterium]|nr:CHASE2 domain-containing protein [Pseudomonadota bacterium]MBU1709294.1 CHASE2 domain-containing protein [Pseudomonadota bacterium]